MNLDTDPDDGRAEKLAAWVRAMDLEDQVFITGATLILEDIRRRRGRMPVLYDEADLREGTPAEAYRHACKIADAYTSQVVHPGPDGVDEHARIVGLTRGIAERIATYHPAVLAR